MLKVSIITVNFNNKVITEEFLDSFYATNNYSNYEIIVVDNASEENPLPDWTIKYPNVCFFRSDKNLGFAGGNNLGIQHAKGDLFFLVNNDTECTPGLLNVLVDQFEKNASLGMCSPKIKYFHEPNMIQYAGYTEMNNYTARNSCIGQFESDNGQYDNQSGETAFGHGAAMMVSKKVIEQVGLMYENYFLYFEEMDWGARIKKAGFAISTNLNTFIFHKESVTVGRKSALKEFFMNRNRILYIRRNANNAQKLIFYIYFFLIVTPRNIIKYLLEGQPGFILILCKAIWWNLSNPTDSKVLGFTLK